MTNFKIFAIAAFALMGTAAMSAKNIASTGNTNEPVAKCQKADCKINKDGKCDKARAKAQGKACDRKSPFEGINLTDSQKSQLKELKAQKRQKTEMTDSAARVARRQGRAEYIKSVKEILTPDQYVVFLENIAINNGPKAQKFDKAGRRGDFDKQAMRQGRKGDNHKMTARRDLKEKQQNK